MRTDHEEFARSARPPDTTSWSAVRQAAKHCEACHLYKHATQTVFGEGPKDAAIMLVREQPGDYEDVAGKPFVADQREESWTALWRNWKSIAAMST